jgi:mannose-6-phosphate isomerase
MSSSLFGEIPVTGQGAGMHQGTTSPRHSIAQPLRFTPFVRPMVWGGRRLGEALGKTLSTAGPHGESWEVSDHRSHHSVVASRQHAGKTLRALMEQERAALLGSAAAAHETFPWLIKFLDACDWLSVQVHPDEGAVQTLWPGEGPKTEAWFILDAAPGSRIYAGLVPGTDEKRFRSALQSGSVLDCLHAFTPQPGDCVFLPAGTVHAVGGGVLMAEVQQTSDATFRLFDWNRVDAQGKPRTLHIEEGLAAIDWKQGPVSPVRVAGFDRPANRRTPLVRCPYFTLEYVQATAPFEVGGDGRLHAAIVLRGRGRLGDEPVAAGQTLLLPAALPALHCTPEPDLGILLCTLP